MQLRKALQSIFGRVRSRNAVASARPHDDRPDDRSDDRDDDPIASDAAVARLVAEWGDQWGNPCLERRRWGWAHFQRSATDAGMPANDCVAAPVAAPVFSACDYACLAQAAMLLGLDSAADALTMSAYLRLEGVCPARVQPSVDAVQHSLRTLHSPPESA